MEHTPWTKDGRHRGHRKTRGKKLSPLCLEWEKKTTLSAVARVVFFTRKTLALHFLMKIIAVLLDHKMCGQKDENDPDKKIKERTLRDLLPFSWPFMCRGRWLVFVSCCFVCFISQGTAFGLGSVYLDILDTFNTSRPLAALVHSLCLGLSYGAGG